MLSPRGGRFAAGQAIIYAEGFSPNTPEGACPQCHGVGRLHHASEASLLPHAALAHRAWGVGASAAGWGGARRLCAAAGASMVRDDALTIREGAVAAWPGAWQGQNL